MKSILRWFIESILLIETSLIVWFYKKRNNKKPRILIYTDSRGFLVRNIWTRKSYRRSFIHNLLIEFNCDVFICPEKHTTFFDFFSFLKRRNNENYMSVICLIGVVDFSPRPFSSLDDLKNSKEVKIHEIKEHYGISLNPFVNYHEEYMNEKTFSILGERNVDNIVSLLNSVPNLIWISCNPIILDWSGNYWRPRPNNINIVNSISKQIINHPARNFRLIDNTHWKKKEVKELTLDNIHYSEKGMELICNNLQEQLNEIFKKKNQITYTS